MTSPPKRPIISLKFKTPPVPPAGSVKPAAAAPQPVPRQPLPRQPSPPPPPAAPPAAEPKSKPARKSGGSISPDVFKAAIKAAGLAIQNIVADPEWKNEELFHQYQSAKERATSTNKHQAKLVSTVATRRHSRDIEHADVESAAMRAAYAAALVALVDFREKAEEPEA